MIQTRREFLASVSLAAAATAAWAAAPGLARSLREPATILPWEPIADGIWSFVDLATGGNSLIVALDRAVVVIDTKSPVYGPAIREDAITLAELPGKRPTVQLINTHHHFDHTGGNLGFMGTGGSGLCHEKCAERIKDQLDKHAAAAAKAVAGAARADVEDAERLAELAERTASRAKRLKLSDILPNSTVGARDHGLEIAGRTLGLHHFGSGHTDNDLVVVIADRNVIHTGDLVFNGLHPFCDPDGGVNIHGWIEALTETRKLCDDDTIVVPGHGEVGDASIIDAQRVYLENLIEKVQVQIETGATEDDVAAMSWPFMDGLGFESIRERAIRATYNELAG